MRIVTQYRPSRENALLGGDFYDVVQTPDGTVHIMVGDVAGHGPDEAALGAALRIAWRALTFAGLRGNDRMRRLEQILRAERAGTGIFATVLSIALRPDGRFTAVRAGHPGMLLHGPGTVRWLEPPAGPALGLGAQQWPQPELELPDGHGLLLLTDGSSRAIPATANNASARTACSRWPDRWRRCPGRSSSTRSSARPNNAPSPTAASPTTSRCCGWNGSADEHRAETATAVGVDGAGWLNLVLAVMGWWCWAAR